MRKFAFRFFIERKPGLVTGGNRDRNYFELEQAAFGKRTESHATIGINAVSQHGANTPSFLEGTGSTLSRVKVKSNTAFAVAIVDKGIGWSDHSR